MKIVVCVKHVPEASDAKFADDYTVDRASIDGALSELDEYAIEQALRLTESGVDAEITHLTMGPAAATDAVRKALAMGGDKAVHVVDDALHGSDAPATALVLARAIERAGFDLVVCGMASGDATMSVVPAMLAERLGVPQVTFASHLSVADGMVRIRRDGDFASEQIEAPLPAVVSVTDQTGEARVPSFRGIMAAKKKPIEQWSLADLGVSPDEVGLAAAWTKVESATRRPPRQAGAIVTDEGEGGMQIAEFLVTQKFI
ncbi:MAG: electron transfer flavoprotein subunit beta/FixA family protein [Mycobacterium leprae]